MALSGEEKRRSNCTDPQGPLLHPKILIVPGGRFHFYDAVFRISSPRYVAFLLLLRFIGTDAVFAFGSGVSEHVNSTGVQIHVPLWLIVYDQISFIPILLRILYTNWRISSNVSEHVANGGYSQQQLNFNMAQSYKRAYVIGLENRVFA
ncbi:hypothetical protein FGSG_11284 [Fusarium graminearum PH-1]|uniref:Chromosome 3, complete genome n=1 Tax=Gibberella zeae (strain ATCC MYA-4620 / CBS 123657 / FGSC 9075 / NRRL 31084 / PH-1) TaxID=229533 RepID=I1S3A9_GIBZE|nr:hypothetical protein FGSG_11284 [Fusarium graminearum PH-1]ESU18339.1 hypothetical protein FGSG_11284 [Fusarium graminearum PH-1]CEF87565.1 unnamed protein product [Fusarium graminearum]|eukprot:XP_011325961.1 hypothetical protein FGSG_11284 [Fusarium graminearum PH-1]